MEERDTDFGRLEVSEAGVTLKLGEEAPQEEVFERRQVTEAELAALAETDAQLNERWPETTIEPTLERMDMLMDLLGSPQHAFDSIHVAGTNGKTSAVRMIESLLRAFHRRTGRTTSPHLQLVTERIGIDGQPIHPADFVRIWEEIKPYVEMVDARSEVSMSKFEVLSALAYAAFADAPVDVAVVEVGMGGVWDATNVINPEVAVITPIGLDHTDYLGESLSDIAAEKAGIIKPGDAVAILGHQEPEAMEVLARRAIETDVAVARLGQEFAVKESSVAVGGQMLSIQGLSGLYEEIFLPLSGAHQADNAAMALAAVEAFFGAGPGHPLDIDSVRRGFAQLINPGRLERVAVKPTTFIDAAHNPQGARALAAAMERDFDFSRLIGVIGVLGDKDYRGILEELEPQLHEVVITRNSSPRAIAAYELADVAREVFGEERVHAVESLPAACALAAELAQESAEGEDVQSGAGVLITGSVVTAGEARALYGKDPQ